MKTENRDSCDELYGLPPLFLELLYNPDLRFHETPWHLKNKVPFLSKLIRGLSQQIKK